MDIKKFERAKEIKEMDLAMGLIRDYIGKGRVHVVSDPYCMNEKSKPVEVTEPVANVIYDALYKYQEELEKEFEEL